MKALVIVICCLLLLQGCATLYKDNLAMTPVEFLSKPKGAMVIIDGVPSDTTPVTFLLKDKQTYHVQFIKEGYDPVTYMIGNHVGGKWIVLNILLTGMVGLIVDAATGAWYEPNQSIVNVILREQSTP